MNKKGVKMVISAAGMAICLLCGGCAGQDAPDTEQNIGNVITSEQEGMDDESAAMDSDSPAVDYGTCPSGTIVDKTLTEADMDGLFTAEAVPDEIFDRINGISYVENENIGRDDLRYLRLLYCGFDGETHVGEMITNAAIADEVLEIFRELYENDYPIEKMLLIDEYGGDDDLAVADNNTSCFNYRVVAGSKKLSRHALGLAIDINPFYNPYVTYPDGVKHSSPPGSEPYADRSVDFPYKIGGKDDLCLQLFDAHGYTWGGRWKSVQDYQHFQK